MGIRKAIKEDNEKLLDLAKSAPMEGIVTAYIDHSPDFFHMPSIQGDDCQVWVADKDDEVEGCIVEVYKTMNYNGGVYKSFYIGDLKVRPKSRGTLGITLSSHIVKEAKSKGFALGECFVIDGNEKMLKVLDWLSKKIFTKVHSGYAIIYQLLPYRKYRVSSKYSIRTASNNDIPSIVKLLQETYKNYSSSPVFTEEYIKNIINNTADFGIENFRIASYNNQDVACAAFWDQYKIRRTVVKKFNTSGKIVVNTLKIVQPLFGFPKLPNAGDALNYTFLKFPAAHSSYIDALRDIIHSESNSLRKLRKYHFIWAGFHQADPLSASVKKMWNMKMKINIFHLKFSEEVELLSEEKSSDQPVYVDFSLI